MDRKLIFLHIPKAGGSTFRPILRMQYPRKTIHTIGRGNGADFRMLPLSRRERIDVLRGHCFFGIHKHLPGDSQYVTFVRDPVDRAISLYWYARNGDGPFSGYAKDLSLRDFVLSGVCPELDNGQVRRVAGLRPAFGGVKEEHLKKAIANIESSFIGVGVVDSYDASLMLIAKRLGWIFPPFYTRLMVNARRPRSGEAASVRDEIREANRWDSKLHSHCRKVVATYADQSSVRRNLLHFRVMNHLVARGLLNPVRRLLKRLRKASR